MGNFTTEFEKIICEDTGVEPNAYSNLSDFSATSYPASNTWTINDETVSSAEDFDGLQAALQNAYKYSSDRRIVLVFPNLTEMPRGDDYLGALHFCKVIVSIDMPKVTSIGDNAFSSCSNLETVDLPLVTSIGGKAFWNCAALESIALPPDVISIGDGAFAGCAALESIALPPDVISIGNYVFRGCSALKSISLSEVTSIGNGAFSDCVALESISLSEVTSIGDGAFSDCVALKSISLSEVTSIGDGAFSDCVALESVSLPEVTSIGCKTFSGCTALKSISLPKLTSLYFETFYNCSSLELISLPTDVTLIGYRAFSGCAALKSISLPEVTSLGYAAFDRCAALESISLPKVAIIENHTFCNCRSLTSLTLATEAKLLSVSTDNAFINVDTSAVTLTTGSDNAECINGNIFTMCDYSANFKEIICVDTGEEPKAYLNLSDFSATSYPASTNTWTINDETVSSAEDFYGLQAALYSIYHHTSDRKISLVFPNLTEMPSHSTFKLGALYDCRAIVSVDMPKVTSIGDDAFDRCYDLKTVKLATDSGVVLSSISRARVFSNAYNIDLTIGSANASLVSGTTLTVGDSSYVFKSITVLE